ncbi:PAS domain-containing protein [Rhodovulum bhavnagarense]|uniref:PAS domain-containing protein n=1 Tax=Rhodovulum bhavnagarense TaxID=992286 RepID=A0A4R2RCM8_9RHOB|nr:PAS-domain containing protein [Rhodovulum bhavnagarense]TCP61150.1 PAS domain-containing protein [Rhodovulum bhavnagarense]
MDLDWAFALVLAATSLGSVVAALLLLPYLPRARHMLSTARPAMEMVFLFDDETLLDATPEALRFIADGPVGLSDWQRLCALLAPRFPGFAQRMARLAQDGSAFMTEAGGHAQLGATWLNGVARITLQIPRTATRAHAASDLDLSALTEELASHRTVADALPIPVWQGDTEHGITWANRAYIGLIHDETEAETPLSWPLPALFPQAVGPIRAALRDGMGDMHWYDCISTGSGAAAVHCALPADAAVRAETTLGNFMQTLTKTFAELPIGLAVFNRARELVLFNPAMSELFNLDPEFLIARPSLRNLLDHLRENRMMPEPKDYRTWREAIERLERDAADGVYSDTWTLPSGQVYRITGRPHPDGAVAFLIEDISAEMSLTRRFRSELETGQAVIDSLDEAIAVFSTGGLLTLSNAAYSDLWGDDQMLLLGPGDIAGATALWQAQCLPIENGAQAPDLGRQIRRRQSWSGEMVHRDGLRLRCRVAPIAGGAVLVGFRPVTAEARASLPVSRATG